jgi:Leucine-rich repeat (LRR) protein
VFQLEGIELPQKFTASCCTALEKLDLTNNDIKELPVEIGLLVNLIELKLRYNRMESIPPELGSCNNLQHLEMHHNSIRGPLPETMGLIQSLRYIDVSFNNIDGIPRSIIE